MIDTERLEEILVDCLYTDEEVQEIGREEAAKQATIVQGIINNFGFNPKKIEKHKDEIYKMLLELPKQFMKSDGGGWSFLNMCIDKNGEQWTGLHRTMEWLVCLGIAIGKVSWQMSREMWDSLPGGMPYFVVDDTDDNPS